MAGGAEQGGEPTAEELEALMRALEEDAAESEASDTTEEGTAQEAPEPGAEAPITGPSEVTQVMAEPELGVAEFFGAWALFGDSALAGGLGGALLGVLGVYILLKRMVFLSAALSQVASLGITLAFFAQAALGWGWVHPILGAGVMTLGVLLALSTRAAQRPGFRDGALGFAYLLGASGTLILGTRIVQELHDVQTILFGSAVAVVPRDFWLIVAVSVVLGGVHLVGWRGFTAVVLDAEDARVRGMPVRGLELTLLLTLAVAVAVSTAVLGALPTFAFSVLPAMVALRVVANVPRALLLSGLLGAAVGFGGYVVAFVYELPVGASQAMLALVVSAVVLGLKGLVSR